MTYAALIAALKEAERQTEELEAYVAERKAADGIFDMMDAQGQDEQLVHFVDLFLTIKMAATVEAIEAFGFDTPEADSAYINAQDTAADYGHPDYETDPVGRFIFADTYHIDQ